MLLNTWLPNELIIGGAVIWLIIALAIFCYGLIFEAYYYCYKKINLPWLKSWIKPLQVLTSALPLLGLLGTIIGLLDTFSVLSHNASFSISDAIGKALLTTEAGLIMSIPALIMLWKLQTMIEQMEAEHAA
ncbi:MAG: biopolymer transport protein ExbB [Alteromonadaceae bacterium]|jgi:biopolymer transport protein ExbB